MERIFCPECHSEACILWDDGYICCSCGCEFDGPCKNEMEETDDDDTDSYSSAVDDSSVFVSAAKME